MKLERWAIGTVASVAVAGVVLGLYANLGLLRVKFPNPAVSSYQWAVANALYKLDLACTPAATQLPVVELPGYLLVLKQIALVRKELERTLKQNYRNQHEVYEDLKPGLDRLDVLIASAKSERPEWVPIQKAVDDLIIIVRSAK